MPPVYDTYAAVRRLVESGISEPQAVAIVNEQFQFIDSIATRHDLALLDQRLTQFQLDVATEFAKVRAEQMASEARIIKYMTGLMIGVTGAGVAHLGTLMTLLKIF